MRAVVVTLASFAFSVGVACGSFSPDAIPEDDAGPVLADATSDQRVVTTDAGVDAPADAHDAAPKPPPMSGCADGTREGFVDSKFSIAACQGAWAIGGIVAGGSPKCGRAAGNDGKLPSGVGCGADDLCAVGWHVCRDASDVGAHGGAAPEGICSMQPTPDGSAFFATAQASDGVGICSPDASAGFDDVFGCGDVASGSPCLPLNVSIGTLLPLAGFSFGQDGKSERKNVVKFPGDGGVLCCED